MKDQAMGMTLAVLFLRNIAMAIELDERSRLGACECGCHDRPPKLFHSGPCCKKCERCGANVKLDSVEAHQTQHKIPGHISPVASRLMEISESIESGDWQDEKIDPVYVTEKGRWVDLFKYTTETALAMNMEPFNELCPVCKSPLGNGIHFECNAILYPDTHAPDPEVQTD